MDDYETDILLWSEHQAALLRRLADGERINALVDWDHVIEEVKDLGLSELRACETLLQQAMTHLLKLAAAPDAAPSAHWREEAGTFLDDASRRYTPSMARRIDLPALYAKALRRARPQIPASPFPPECPFTLSELLEAEIAPLLARLIPP